MPFAWLRTRRRDRLISQPFPHAWRDVLTRRVRHYRYLNTDQRERLETFIQVICAEKEWAGGSGFQVNDEIKVAISGYAAVMTLGLPEPYYFDRLRTIIVYAGAYQPQNSRYEQHPEQFLEPRLGEAWHRGPVVLSWDEISGQSTLRPGSNLAIHEFAHHIDGLDGDVDGTPAIVGQRHRHTWHQIVEAEFERLRRDAFERQASLLDRNRSRP
ncbi:MAG: zinc-dependent peptidase [Pirellulales bacterium]|nr:zinc-dependent peptidase [Pirellulales bacterium]